MLQPTVAARKHQEAAATLLSIIRLCVEILSLCIASRGVLMVFERFGGVTTASWLNFSPALTLAAAALICQGTSFSALSSLPEMAPAVAPALSLAPAAHPRSPL